MRGKWRWAKNTSGKTRKRCKHGRVQAEFNILSDNNRQVADSPDIGQRGVKLINQIIQNGDQWPVTNQQLISRHLRNFCEFGNAMNL